MYLAFNEAAVSEENYNGKVVQNERDIINNFIHVLIEVKKNLNLTSLIATEDFYNFRVSSTYGINDWLNDSLVKKKYKDFFRTFRNMKCNSIDKNDYPLNEFIIMMNGHALVSTGCLFALENDEDVVSVVTDKLWSNNLINGKLNSVSCSNILTTSERKVENIYDKSQIALLKSKFKSQSFKEISSGQDLWEKRKELFPNLVFCENVKAQLYKDSEKFHIDQVIKRLLGLQQYFENCDEVYNPSKLGLYARTESESVKKNPDLRALRLFKKPDGISEYFYDHIGFVGKYCGRIHFIPDNENKKCYIGYIGRHLPTKKY